MSAVVVFDLDKVLLGGDASTLFLRGRLSQSPARLLPLLLASPVLLPGSALPHTRPLAARVMTRLAVGGRSARRWLKEPADRRRRPGRGATVAPTAHGASGRRRAARR